MSKKEFDLSSIHEVVPIEKETLAPHTNHTLDIFADRTTISYSNFPVKAVELMEKRSKDLGLTKKRFLWEALRGMGVDLPEYDEVFRPYSKNK